ncbi:MAG: hypothetical protein AAFV53_31820 [Myxococcota bacterium]
MADAANSGKHLKVLKSAAKKLKGTDAVHAFYFVRGPEGSILHIDPMAGKPFARFRTPRLIDEHIKKARYDKDGLAAGGSLKKFRSCAGEVSWDASDNTFRFDVKSRAGKAGPSDLKKGLASTFKAKILGAPGKIGASKDLATVPDAPVDIGDTIAALFGAGGLESGKKPSQLELSGDIEQLGQQIGDLQAYLTSGAALSDDARQTLQKTLERMETMFETVEQWDVSSGVGQLQKDFHELSKDIEDEALSNVESLLKGLDPTAEDAQNQVAEILREISDSSLPSDTFQSLIGELEGRLNDNDDLKSFVTVFQETEQIADRIGQDFDINQELLQEGDALAEAAFDELLQKLGQDNVLSDKDKKTLKTWGPHIKILAQSFKGGKQGALYAGRVGSLARRWGGDAKNWTAAAEGDVKGTIAMYGAFKQEGESLLEGIVYLANAGFLSEGSMDLTAEAQANLGVMSGKIQGLLKLYAQVSGNASAELSLSASEGISAKFSAEIGAVATAEANGWVSVEIDGLAKAQAEAFAKAVASAEGKASGSFILSPRGVLVADGSVSARLGVSAEVGGSASVTTADGDELFKTAAKVGVTAGFAFELGGRFSLEAGKVRFRVNLGAAVGIGGNLEMDVTVDLKKVAETIVNAIVDTLKTVYKKHPVAYRILNGETNSAAVRIEMLVQDDAALRARMLEDHGRQTAFGIEQLRGLYGQLVANNSKLPRIEPWYDDDEEKVKAEVIKQVKAAHQEIRKARRSEFVETSGRLPLHTVFDARDGTAEAKSAWAKAIRMSVIEVSFCIEDIQLAVTNDPEDPITISSITLNAA